jgi:hypothetical protein
MLEQQHDRSSPEQHNPPTPGHACGAVDAKRQTLSEFGEELVKGR